MDGFGDGRAGCFGTLRNVWRHLNRKLDGAHAGDDCGDGWVHIMLSCTQMNMLRKNVYHSAACVVAMERHVLGTLT